MIYVALAEAAALAVVAISFAGILRWSIRQHARERELLVNQVCHLSGRPWAEAPAWEPKDEEEQTELWTMPEQLVT